MCKNALDLILSVTHIASYALVDSSRLNLQLRMHTNSYTGPWLLLKPVPYGLDTPTKKMTTRMTKIFVGGAKNFAGLIPQVLNSSAFTEFAHWLKGGEWENIIPTYNAIDLQ